MASTTWPQFLATRMAKGAKQQPARQPAKQQQQQAKQQPRAKPHVGKSSSGKKNANVEDDDDDDDDDLPSDDVDRYMQERRKRQSTKPTAAVFDDDNAEDTDDDMEEVFGLDGLDDDEDDDEDEEEDEDDDDDEEVDNLGFEKKKEKEVSLKAWGSSRKPFYGADVGDDDLSSDEDINEEEQEVKRLQKEKLSSLQQEDFELSDSFNKRSKQPTKKMAPSTVSSAPSSVTVEQIEEDLGGLTQDELLSIVQQDSPEVIQLLADLKAKVEEIRQQLLPQLELVREGKTQTSKGISLLDVKYHLLMSYCTNICFYLYLKTSGASVKDHPVVLQMVEQRALIEKLKPVEAKLRYQINKLVSAANDSTSSSTASKGGAVDPLMFRPNLNLLVSGKGTVGFGAEDDDNVNTTSSNGLYKAPKLAPAAYTTEKDKALSKAEKLKKKASAARMLKDLRTEFSEQPEEFEDDTLQTEVDEGEVAKERYEEDNFIRLSETRKDRLNKRKRLEQQFRNEFEDLNDFGDSDPMDEKDPLKLLGKRQRTEAPPSKKGAAKFGDDEMDGQGDGNNDEDDEGSELYENAKNAKQRRRDERLGKAKQYDAAVVDAYAEDEEGGAGKRGATYQIIKNKGLTVKRKKEQRNPRVKRRVKYETAMKKLKSVGTRVVEREAGPYGGELTGIKTNTARSVSLK